MPQSPSDNFALAERQGLPDDLLRLSIGIEHEADLSDELEQALASLSGE